MLLTGPEQADDQQEEDARHDRRVAPRQERALALDEELLDRDEGGVLERGLLLREDAGHLVVAVIRLDDLAHELARHLDPVVDHRGDGDNEGEAGEQVDSVKRLRHGSLSLL